ncbi:hypothetical protein B0H14DRAFT_2569392 [Mycena olivaceomarginata]|nr:hypothetical protein B0H14DRAFT_2569392 [Mycena olivaceomarginata]
MKSFALAAVLFALTAIPQHIGASPLTPDPHGGETGGKMGNIERRDGPCPGLLIAYPNAATLVSLMLRASIAERHPQPTPSPTSKRVAPSRAETLSAVPFQPLRWVFSAWMPLVLEERPTSTFVSWPLR